jgi:integrase
MTFTSIAATNITSPTIDRYITAIETMSKSTAKTYRFRLRIFNLFILNQYEKASIDDVITKLKKGKFDPYEMLSKYVLYLQRHVKVSSLTLKQWVVTAKNFLEYHDVDISPRKFKLKIRLPKVVRKDKQALTKEDIVEILNACDDTRTKTYVMLLAATGMRAAEALSIKIKDLDFKSNPPKLFVRGENTKTKVDRTVFLTNEVAKQLSAWINYKHRTRRVCHVNHNGKSITEYRTPKIDQNDLIFAVRTQVHDVNNLYVNICMSFDKTLDRIGMGTREGLRESSSFVANSHNKVNRVSIGDRTSQRQLYYERRQITLHSLRRWVKSTISDLGYGDYSEYFLGHANVSTYYRKTEKERAELFRKIEPYLTFLDFNQLSARQADISTALEQKEDELITLKTSQRQLQDELNQLRTMMQTISDKYLVTLATPTEKKIMDKHRTPTPEEFVVIEKEKEEARIAEANEQVSKSTHYYT